MTKRIVIEGTAPEKTTVNLVGVDYLLTTPKAVLGVNLGKAIKQKNDDPDAQLDALRKWLTAAGGKKQADAIMKRLADAEDLLDLKHIFQLINALVEDETENPTT